MDDPTATAAVRLSVEDLDGLTSWTVIRAAHRLEQQLTALFAAHGLTPVQFGVLAHLATGRPLTRAQLAREVLVRPQSVAGVLDGLVARGLVVLAGHGGRGRPNPASLSGDGERLLAELWPLVQAADRAPHLPLSQEEAEVVNRLLLRLAAGAPPRPALDGGRVSAR